MFRPPVFRLTQVARTPLPQRRTIATAAAAAAGPSRFVWSTRFILTAATHLLATTSLGIYIASRTHPMLSSGPMEKHAHLPVPAFPAPPPPVGIIDALARHPLYLQLTSPDSKWTFIDAWKTLLPAQLASKLIPGTYSGPRRIELNRVFTSEDGKEMVSFLAVGTAMCGFPGIVHGGVSASVLDEAFGRLAIQVVGGDAVTARLGLQYRKPVVAGREGRERVLVCRARVERIEGRKVVVKGGLEDERGNVLVDAEALFVVPKGWKPKTLVGFT